MGLSGSVFTTVYMGAFKPHMLRFLLFLAAAPPLVGAAALAFVNLVPPHSRPLAPFPGDQRASLTLKQAAGGALLLQNITSVRVLPHGILAASHWRLLCVPRNFSSGAAS